MRCFFCKGNLEASITSHVVTLDNCIVIVKKVPCTRCTQCGEAFFDDDVAMQLEQIVKGIQAAATEIAVINYSDKVA